MLANISGEDPYLTIFGRFSYSFLRILVRQAKPVEIPRKQVVFHCKGILIADSVTTNQFSQLKLRKSNDRNNYLEKFLLRFKELPISCGTIAF